MKNLQSFGKKSMQNDISHLAHLAQVCFGPSGASMFGPHLAQVCFGASVPNIIIKPERKLRGIICVSSILPVCNRI